MFLNKYWKWVLLWHITTHNCAEYRDGKDNTWYSLYWQIWEAHGYLTCPGNTQTTSPHGHNWLIITTLLLLLFYQNGKLYFCLKQSTAITSYFRFFIIFSIFFTVLFSMYCYEVKLYMKLYISQGKCTFASQTCTTFVSSVLQTDDRIPPSWSIVDICTTEKTVGILPFFHA